MKKIGIVAVACLATVIIAIAGNVTAGDGPVPDSGDGIPNDGGFDERVPNGEGVFGDGYGEPAPNSGDGISDGPGR